MEDKQEEHLPSHVVPNFEKDLEDKDSHNSQAFDMEREESNKGNKLEETVKPFKSSRS